jgi:hypothetical protein
MLTIIFDPKIETASGKGRLEFYFGHTGEKQTITHFLIDKNGLFVTGVTEEKLKQLIKLLVKNM